MPRPKREFRTASRENYKVFCTNHPEIVISFVQYKKILYTYNNLLGDYILNTGNLIKLPFGLGHISINKYKRNKYKKNTITGEKMIHLPVNWLESKKYGKRIYHLNLHSDGYMFCWYWSPKEARFKFTDIWKVEFCRVLSRKLPATLKENPGYKDIYVEYTSRLYKKN
jgi:hypothetical protein